MIKKFLESYIFLIITISFIFSGTVAAESNRGISVYVNLKYSDSFSLNAAKIIDTKVYEVSRFSIPNTELGQHNIYFVEVLDNSKKVIYSFSDEAVLFEDEAIADQKDGSYASYNLPWSKDAKFIQIRKDTTILDSKQIPNSIIDNTKTASLSEPNKEKNVVAVDLLADESYDIKSADGFVTFSFSSGSFKEDVFLVIEKIETNIKYTNGRIKASGVYQIRANNAEGVSVSKLEKPISIKFKIDKNIGRVKSETQKVTFLENDLGKVQYLKSEFGINEVKSQNTSLGLYLLTSEEDSNIYILGINAWYILIVSVSVALVVVIIVRIYIIKKRKSKPEFIDDPGMLS
ncbi:MAG: hypothetical protein WCK26_00165 [Candidatus Saccharibacteria bacterium]